MASLTRITDAVVEPITTAEAKAHLRIDHADEDTYIGELITIARQLFERYTNRALAAQTWTLTLDEFPPSGDPIELNIVPVTSITSIRYYDTNDTQQTWVSSSYVLNGNALPATVEPAVNQTYPSTSGRRDAVEVIFVAGSATQASEFEEMDKSIIRLLVAHLYENRVPVVTGTVATKLPMSLEWAMSLRSFERI